MMHLAYKEVFDLVGFSVKRSFKHSLVSFEAIFANVVVMTEQEALIVAKALWDSVPKNLKCYKKEGYIEITVQRVPISVVRPEARVNDMNQQETDYVFGGIKTEENAKVVYPKRKRKEEE